MILKAVFYLGITVLGLGLLGICLAGVPSDPIVDYSVINNTDRELTTWLMTEDCAKVVGFRLSYTDPETVVPRQRLEYSHIGIDGRGCIQVVTDDRRIVAAQEYERSAVVVVSEPLTYLSDPVPPEADLPKKPREPLVEVFTTDAPRIIRLLEVSFLLIALGGGSAFAAHRIMNKR